jgi:acetate kinase
VTVRVLVVNAGSSSLKLSVIEDGRRVEHSSVERWEGEEHLEPLREFVEQVAPVEAVGHRIVHGGPRLTEATLVDDDVLDYLDSIVDLAPLHNPRGTAGIRAARRVVERRPEVVCFDTSFHAQLSPAAHTFALPREWNRRWSLRRYGFHGLSHAYAVRRGAELAGQRLARLRVVSCHLGSGASLAAVVDGRSVDTTMGFTPTDGVVMGTRPGSVDPGLLVWLLRHGQLTVDDLDTALEHDSGLKGLTGTSGDLRDVLERRDAGDEDAALAYAVYVHRLVRDIGAMAASAGGLDLLVMTGGVGENSARLRADVAAGLEFLGVVLEEEVNEVTTSDGLISAGTAEVSVVVVSASEDVEVARETDRALSV